MSALSEATKNRLLFAGLGIATFGVLRWSWRLLVDYRNQAQLPKEERKAQYINQATEDALKPQTLTKLIQSPNWGISETAARIVVDRSLHSKDALDELLWHVTRSDHDEREAGIRALHLLTESGTFQYILFAEALTHSSLCDQTVRHPQGLQRYRKSSRILRHRRST